MEINRFEDVLGVALQEDIVEGRFVLLTADNLSDDFGNAENLPGVRYPLTAEEAKHAHYVLTWPVENRPTPIVQSYPHPAFSTRNQFGTAANAPFSATIYLTPPGNQEGLTLPSGSQGLAYTVGTFTLPSGAYVSTDTIKVVGALITVEYSGADKGKPKYAAAMDASIVGEVERYDSTTGALTVRVR